MRRSSYLCLVVRMVQKESEVAEVPVTRCLVVCRIHQEPVWLVLPCNWVKSGLCGDDARPCDIEILDVES